MNIWTWEQQYDPKTGNPSGFDDVFEALLCDATGRTIDQQTYKSCKYAIQPEGHDLFVGSLDEEARLRDEYGIELYPFVMERYVFISDWRQSEYGEVQFLECVTDFETLHEALRACRARTAIRLLEEGKIDAHQLTGGPPKE